MEPFNTRRQVLRLTLIYKVTLNHIDMKKKHEYLCNANTHYTRNTYTNTKHIRLL